MSYTNDELRRIQLIELDILKEIKQVCYSNNIEFFIIGGTALGAKRHGGFIPWDDDIDIGMTRKNYDRFIDIAKIELSTGYYLQTPWIDKNSPFPYVKIRKDDTKFVEWCNRNTKMHKGIYVDVFPYDNIPNDEKLRKKQFKVVQKLSRLYVYKKTPDIIQKPVRFIDYMKIVLWKVIYLILKIFPSKSVLENLERQMYKYNNQDTSTRACLFFPKYMVECMDNNVLYPIKPIMFEGLEVPSPNNLEQYLTTHYGNYMELPPINEREGHKPYIVKLK